MDPNSSLWIPSLCSVCSRPCHHGQPDRGTSGRARSVRGGFHLAGGSPEVPMAPASAIVWAAIQVRPVNAFLEDFFAETVKRSTLPSLELWKAEVMPRRAVGGLPEPSGNKQS